MKATQGAFSKKDGVVSRASHNESKIKDEVSLIDDVVRSRALSRAGECGEQDQSRRKAHEKARQLRRVTTALRTKNGGSLCSKSLVGGKAWVPKEHGKLHRMCDDGRRGSGGPRANALSSTFSS